MSVSYSQFQGEIALAAKKFWQYGNMTAELNAISAALASDATTHDETIQNPVSATLQYGNLANTDFQDAVLYCVNKAKAGNLSNASIAQAIDGVTGALSPPGVIDVPYASANASPPIVGTVCSCTTGNWAGTPTSYTYQWTRNGVNIGAATAATYTLVAADTGLKQIACVVTATNATGSTVAPPSNAIAVP